MIDDICLSMLCHNILDRILYYCLHKKLFFRMHLMIVFCYQTLADTIITWGIQKKEIESWFYITSCNITWYIWVLYCIRGVFLGSWNARMQEKETHLSRQSFCCNQCKSNCFCILIWQDNLLRIMILRFFSKVAHFHYFNWLFIITHRYIVFITLFQQNSYETC